MLLLLNLSKMIKLLLLRTILLFQSSIIIYIIHKIELHFKLFNIFFNVFNIHKGEYKLNRKPSTIISY